MVFVNSKMGTLLLAEAINKVGGGVEETWDLQCSYIVATGRG